jgi:hypothetical protein
MLHSIEKTRSIVVDMAGNPNIVGQIHGLLPDLIAHSAVLVPRTGMSSGAVHPFRPHARSSSLRLRSSQNAARSGGARKSIDEYPTPSQSSSTAVRVGCRCVTAVARKQ